MSIDTLDKLTIRTRNQMIVEDYKKLTSKEPTQSLQDIFHHISDKYNVSIANAKNLYYLKFKKTSTIPANQKPSIIDSSEDKAVLKEIISLHNKKVRVYILRGDVYLVAKEMLRACGIKSQSHQLNAVTNDTNRLYVPILSSQGLMRTRIIRLDACLQFFRNIADEHSYVSVRMKAQSSYEQLEEYALSIGLETAAQHDESVDTVAEPMSVEETKLTEPTPAYQSGDTVEFTVTNISSKLVTGITADDFETPASIYISDVTDKYIRNLRTYFTTGEIITATVKHYDKERQKLTLTTRNSQIELLIQQQKHVDVSLPIGATVPEESASTSPFSLDVSSLFESILEFINQEGRIGALTPQAKTKLIELLNTEGVVKVVSSIKDTIPSFEPDLGLVFLNDVEKQMKKACL